MIVRRGRLLPSVIVGALVAGAVTLGAGVASAAEDGDPCYVLLKGQGTVQDGNCVTSGGTVLAPLVGALLGRPPESESPPTSSAPSGLLPRVADGVDNTLTSLGNNAGSPSGGTQNSGSPASATSSGSSSSQSETTSGTESRESSQAGPAQGPAAAPSALPAPDVRGAVAPAAATPGGLLTGMPTLGFGRPNPGLFAPLGSPLRTLTGVSPGSPVTTSSDVQAMAFDSLPGGLGTPAITGVVILSVLGAFALRHRIFRRARTSASAES